MLTALPASASRALPEGRATAPVDVAKSALATAAADPARASRGLLSTSDGGAAPMSASRPVGAIGDSAAIGNSAAVASLPAGGGGGLAARDRVAVARAPLAAAAAVCGIVDAALGGRALGGGREEDRVGTGRELDAISREAGVGQLGRRPFALDGRCGDWAREQR